jgi:hypothetical protein
VSSVRCGGMMPIVPFTPFNTLSRSTASCLVSGPVDRCGALCERLELALRDRPLARLALVLFQARAQREPGDQEERLTHWPPPRAARPKRRARRSRSAG